MPAATYLSIPEKNFIKGTPGGIMSRFSLSPDLTDKVVLGDTSDEAPALVSHDGRLFLSWKGSGNPQLNLMFSDDDGATFQGKVVFGDTSPHGPSLASQTDGLFLGWTGEGDGNLNVAQVALFADSQGGFGIEGLENKVVLGDTSDAGPALVSLNGTLYLAWRGSGNTQLNLMFSLDNGATFQGKTVFDDTSPHAPALVAHGDELFMAWTGEGGGNLNIAQVAFFADTQGGFGIQGLENKVVLGDTSDEGPALASFDGVLFLGWRGSGNTQLNLMFSQDNGATFEGKTVFDDTSPHAPALAPQADRLFMGWTGEGDGNLNVAVVAQSGGLR
ncbi:hypothetical protein [Streptomyces morookaense]|uniref:Exo-alpha-sialidase n=1 Tax=Streptomyces morookaense TaxID=1970 RepID=A0A7Y7E7H1_STRMO|nr:hypothetical protein [Streptomyces morookaense]NVK78978.1 hypothetical protein [Streptomyces morookaense]